MRVVGVAYKIEFQTYIKLYMNHSVPTVFQEEAAQVLNNYCEWDEPVKLKVLFTDFDKIYQPTGKLVSYPAQSVDGGLFNLISITQFKLNSNLKRLIRYLLKGNLKLLEQDSKAVEAPDSDDDYIIDKKHKEVILLKDKIKEYRALVKEHDEKPFYIGEHEEIEKVLRGINPNKVTIKINDDKIDKSRTNPILTDQKCENEFRCRTGVEIIFKRKKMLKTKTNITINDPKMDCDVKNVLKSVIGKFNIRWTSINNKKIPHDFLGKLQTILKGEGIFDTPMHILRSVFMVSMMYPSIYRISIPKNLDDLIKEK
jgi:hypothetical protein